MQVWLNAIGEPRHHNNWTVEMDVIPRKGDIIFAAGAFQLVEAVVFLPEASIDPTESPVEPRVHLYCRSVARPDYFMDYHWK